jgi:hypothetical protein
MQQNMVIPQWDEMPPMSFVEQIACIAYRLKMLNDGTEAPLKHIFEPGVYIREMEIPEGVVVIGRPHTKGHRTQLVSGSVLHVTEHGRRVLESPYEEITVPMFQVVVFTLSPVVARTYHVNASEERDIKKLESEWFLPPEPILKLGAMIHERLASLPRPV